MTNLTNLKFTKTHEWLQSSGNENLVGITNHAQELLGDVVFVDLKDVGEEVQQGDTIGVVESVKAASDIYAPVSGKIVAVNDAVRTNPELLNQDPFGKGWLVKIEPSNLDEMNELLVEEEYLNTIKESD